MALGLPRGVRPRASYELILNSVGDAELPARLRRDAARGAARPRRDGSAPTASGGPRRTRCASSTARSRGAGADRVAARRSPTTSAPSAATTSRRCGGELDLLGIALSPRATAWCAASTTTQDDLRGHERRPRRAEQPPRRRPLRRPGEGRSADPTSRASASRSAWSAWCSPCRRRGRARRCDVFLAPRSRPRRLDRALRAPADAARRPGLRVLMDHEGRSFKSQMKRADKLGARFVAHPGRGRAGQKGVWTRAGHGGSAAGAGGAPTRRVARTPARRRLNG